MCADQCEYLSGAYLFILFPNVYFLPAINPLWLSAYSSRFNNESSHNKDLLSNSWIYFHKLTCIFQKCLFQPYLPQVGERWCGGSCYEWMGAFHCCVRPSSFPHLLPSPHALPWLLPLLPLHPSHLEASLPCQSHETVYSCLGSITLLISASYVLYLTDISLLFFLGFDLS